MVGWTVVWRTSDGGGGDSCRVSTSDSVRWIARGRQLRLENFTRRPLEHSGNAERGKSARRPLHHGSVTRDYRGYRRFRFCLYTRRASSRVRAVAVFNHFRNAIHPEHYDSSAFRTGNDSPDKYIRYEVFRGTSCLYKRPGRF